MPDNVAVLSDNVVKAKEEDSSRPSSIPDHPLLAAGTVACSRSLYLAGGWRET